MKQNDNKSTLLPAATLNEAVSRLRRGELLAFPTETVYALAGDARNKAVIEKIYQLKQRPLQQPLSVLLPHPVNLKNWVAAVPTLAEPLIHHFWPGPLTLIFNKHPSVLPTLTGGSLKIGLRVPDQPIAQQLLQAFGNGLAAPSANRSTQLSPTQAAHVRNEFGNKLTILGADECTLGIESTLLDLTTSTPSILRLGAISQVALQQVLGMTVQLIKTAQPKKEARLTCIPAQQLKQQIDQWLSSSQPIVVIARGVPLYTHPSLHWITMPEQAEPYARCFYDKLRAAKAIAGAKILIEAIPNTEKWSGIHAILSQWETN
jgi:L-threonylcarbamoyladenylate synthase